MASPDSEHPRGAASRPISWDIASPFGLVDKVGEGLLVFRLYENLEALQLLNVCTVVRFSVPRASPHQTYQTYDTIGTTQATSWAPEVATAETATGQYHPGAHSGIEAAYAAIVTHAAMVTHDRGNPADVVRPPTPTFVAADQHPSNSARSDHGGATHGAYEAASSFSGSQASLLSTFMRQEQHELLRARHTGFLAMQRVYLYHQQNQRLQQLAQIQVTSSKEELNLFLKIS
jgi:hypothetical protein